MLTRDQIAEIITTTLLANGWTPSRGFALAIKTFETFVGPREAFAYLSSGDGYNYTIQGDYQSEGRNALSTAGVLIPVDSNAEKVRIFAEAFIKNADTDVGETYAMRLLK